MQVARLLSRQRLSSVCLLSLSILIPFLVNGCGGGSIAVDLNTIAAVTASVSALRVNQTLQLSSRYMSSGLPMNFYVNGVLGGNSILGTISSTGLYTAPAVVPNPYTVKITSTIT